MVMVNISCESSCPLFWQLFNFGREVNCQTLNLSKLQAATSGVGVGCALLHSVVHRGDGSKRRLRLRFVHFLIHEDGQLKFKKPNSQFLSSLFILLRVNEPQVSTLF